MKRILLLVLIVTSPVIVTAQSKSKGILLEDLTWLEAEKVLTKQTVVVIPLGAAAKEHGPHLKLKNDWLMAEYLKKRVPTRRGFFFASDPRQHQLQLRAKGYEKP